MPDTSVCPNCGRTPDVAAFLEGAAEVTTTLSSALGHLDDALRMRAAEQSGGTLPKLTIVEGGKDDA